MSEFFSIIIEAELAGSGNGWTTLEDVIQPIPIDFKYGIDGHRPHDRVAGPGTLSFALDNSEYNSQGAIGLYSPGHANVLSGWGLGTELRVRLEYVNVASYFKWRGTVDSIKPLPGTGRDRRVFVTCVDWMDETLRATLRGVGVQINQRSDQLFQTIVDNIVKQPAATQIGFGMEQYAYALDQARDFGVSVLSEFQKLASSELGFIFLKGDALQGGTLVFEDRRARAISVTPVATFTSVNVLDADRARGDIINRVQVKTHPRRVDALVGGSDPSTISGLTLWMIADDLALIDGAAVSVWPNDRGSGAGTFDQGTGSAKPVYKTGIVNGHSVVRFDGTGDFLLGSLALSAYFTDSASTMFVVAKKDNVDVEYMFGGNNATPQISLGASSAGVIAGNNDGSADTATEPGDPVAGFFIATWMHDSGQIRAGFSDTRDASLTSVASGNTTALTHISIVGGTSGAASLWDGDIAEILIWNVALSQSDRQSVESYLALKYGITLPYTPVGAGVPGTAVFNLEDTPFIARNTDFTILCPYKDPDQKKARIGSIAQLVPEPTTDYLFNSEEDGTGTDLTAQLEVTASFGGNTADVSIVNNGPSDGYLTFLQIRGLGIYDEAEVVLEAEDTASQAQVGEHVLNFDMPYQSDPNVARDAAFYLLEQNKTQFTVPTKIGFIASGSDAFMRQAILREPSDRISIVDPMTAIDGDFFINGIHLSVDSEGVLRCEWTLVPADLSLYWVLDSPTQSQLGETTKLAYGLFNRYWLLGIAGLGSDTRLS